MLTSLKVAVAFDEASLLESIPGVPDEIVFGKTGFFLGEFDENDSGYIAIFIVCPETIFLEEIPAFVMSCMQKAQEVAGINLPTVAYLKVMHDVLRASVTAKRNLQ
jgi:hypothetical protein